MNRTDRLVALVIDSFTFIAKPKPTWTDKLKGSKPAVIKLLNKTFADMPEGSQMMIASPAIIDHYIRNLSPGQFITPKQLRADLADSHKAEHTCPVTTGIFLRIVAEAAWEHIWRVFRLRRSHLFGE